MKTRIIREFQLSEDDFVSDEYILSNPNLMELDNDIDFIRNVPFYMYWCVSNKDREGELVFDFTVSALGEFGRCRDPSNKSLNFLYLCNTEQRKVVLEFLIWCKSELKLHYEPQISRAIKNWSVS